MPAYMVARIEVTDPVRYETYKALSPAAVAAFGGRFLVRGGAIDVLEGDDDRRRIVVVEFPDMTAGRAFYDSPLYGEARQARAGAAAFDAVLMEGL